MYRLLQLSILAMAVAAAPVPILNVTHDIAHNNHPLTHSHSHVERATLRERPPPPPLIGGASKRPRVRNDLLALLDTLDMKNNIAMATPPATGTNNLSDKGAGYLPKSIRLTTGSFDPIAILKENRQRFLVNEDTYNNIETLFKATKLTKDMVKIPISGEGGLSHMLYQQVGGIVNLIVRALGSPAAWSIRARGAAPIEDWQLVAGEGVATAKTLAVLELKTPDSLPRTAVENIEDMINRSRLQIRPLGGSNTDDKGVSIQNIDSLVDTFGGASSRPKRRGNVRAMEQIIAQMYATQAPIGVLTSGDGESLVLQKLTDNWDQSARGEFEVTFLYGSPSRQNHLAGILIAVAITAEKILIEV